MSTRKVNAVASTAARTSRRTLHTARIRPRAPAPVAPHLLELNLSGAREKTRSSVLSKGRVRGRRAEMRARERNRQWPHSDRRRRAADCDVGRRLARRTGSCRRGARPRSRWRACACRGRPRCGNSRPYLGGRESYPVAARLRELGVPFAFATGQGRQFLEAGFPGRASAYKSRSSSRRSDRSSTRSRRPRPTRDPRSRLTPARSGRRSPQGQQRLGRPSIGTIGLFRSYSPRIRIGPGRTYARPHGVNRDRLMTQNPHDPQDAKKLQRWGSPR